MNSHDEKQVVAYILVASHSGSMLLAMLLDSHPEFCSVGELKVGVPGGLDNYLCSYRCKIVACPFWSQVRVQMREAGEDFELIMQALTFALRTANCCAGALNAEYGYR